LAKYPDKIARRAIARGEKKKQPGAHCSEPFNPFGPVIDRCCCCMLSPPLRTKRIEISRRRVFAASAPQPSRVLRKRPHFWSALSGTSTSVRKQRRCQQVRPRRNSQFPPDSRVFPHPGAPNPGKFFPPGQPVPGARTFLSAASCTPSGRQQMRTRWADWTLLRTGMSALRQRLSRFVMPHFQPIGPALATHQAEAVRSLSQYAGLPPPGPWSWPGDRFCRQKMRFLLPFGGAYALTEPQLNESPCRVFPA